MLERDPEKNPLNAPVSVAPMLDWTDRHCRYFHRLLNPQAVLYTEMITTGALIHGDRDRFLAFDPAEHPVVLQLGGSSPKDLALCARYGRDAGYDEINLNCGCPSDRVQSGRFGACLMADPALVADCVAAMADTVSCPVSVKCRIGIDDSADPDFLEAFVDALYRTGCRRLVLHARKAWLNGLSPKENRDVPPLQYEIADHIRAAYPDVFLTVNGGVRSVSQVSDFLGRFDAVMIGREAYQNPMFLAELHSQRSGNIKNCHSRESGNLLEVNRRKIPASAGMTNKGRGGDFSSMKTNEMPDRFAVARSMAAYARREGEASGTPVKSVARHMTGLFNGGYGARRWRRALSERILMVPDSTPEDFARLIDEIETAFLDKRAGSRQ